MKIKAEKNNQMPKLEKKNKKLTKEDINLLFNNKDKEKNNKENINMFTEGLSYENIDHNKYKKALNNFNNLFGRDLNKSNNNKKIIETKEKNVQISKKYLYERALYNGIEIELKIDNNDVKNINLDEVKSSLNTFLKDRKNFFYHEYSNTRNISFSKLSEGDFLSYNCYYKDFDHLVIDNNSSNKEDYIKQLDYVNTMNNLFYKYNSRKKLFYIITPLYSFSFDYSKEIPLLLTNSKLLEIEFKKNDIKIIKIKAKLDKNKINKEKEKATNAKSINPENRMDIIEEDYDEIENNINGIIPIGVSKLYIGFIYNYFVNQNISKPFNIFSNFEFEGAMYRKCKYQIIKIKNDLSKNNNSILIKIEGIIFEENIKNIVEYLKNELKINYFSIRLDKIKSTSGFYLANNEIESSFDKFEFKKDNFYFYKQ